jgi:hypothetical protein
MAKPNVETLGYYHASLRDEHEMLVALGWKPALRGLGMLVSLFGHEISR